MSYRYPLLKLRRAVKVKVKDERVLCRIFCEIYLKHPDGLGDVGDQQPVDHKPRSILAGDRTLSDFLAELHRGIEGRI